MADTGVSSRSLPELTYGSYSRFGEGLVMEVLDRGSEPAT
ncbi:uncharacterized protein G2W53_022138 [Senna tora]|uniref:Uncharacterized protein n=1 Tax=Senna tora TaxID=362788 RepID=A0A834TTY9_9FABA|nr:uncharacterized protein G2W53_022138 [Senna tora]